MFHLFSSFKSRDKEIQKSVGKKEKKNREEREIAGAREIRLPSSYILWGSLFSLFIGMHGWSPRAPSTSNRREYVIYTRSSYCLAPGPRRA